VEEVDMAHSTDGDNLSSEAPTKAERRPLHVLLVEDELFWNQWFISHLKLLDPDVQVDTAMTVLAAESLMVKNHLDYDFVICDYFLDGGRNGLALWQWLGRKKSPVPFLLASGMDDWAFAQMLAVGKDKRRPLFISKNCATEHFLEVVKCISEATKSQRMAA
jgi:hypothetical protein